MSKAREPSQSVVTGSSTQSDAAAGEGSCPELDNNPPPILDGAKNDALSSRGTVPLVSSGEIVMALRHQADDGAYLEALRDMFGHAFRAESFDAARWPAPMLSQLCADALLAGIHVGAVAQLIRQRHLHPDGPEVLHWPWPMRIYTLGRFSLVRDGKAVIFSGKSPRKPLELLQALIALGGRDVHISRLMHALWPESDGRDLRKLFDNTLHRLRQIFHHEEAVMLRDAKLTLDARHCWVDAWAFDSIASRMCEGETVPQQLAHEARRLYQGHFLQRDAQEPWLLPYAERLRSRFQRFILVQGERLEQDGQWESASHVYEYAIEIDNLAEILYRRLMVCLLQRGEFAEAVRVYRRCCDLLSIVLGVKPSLETEAIRLRAENR